MAASVVCREAPRRAAGPAPARAAPLPAPFAGSRSIAIDSDAAAREWGGKTALDGLSLAEIETYRIAKVKEHAALGIFPPDYRPTLGDQRFVWTSITSGARWLASVPHYVANPYRLVVLTCANHTTPLSHTCPGASLDYLPGRFEERVSGEAARCMLARIYETPYADQPGKICVVTVNASDAGYPWASVDLASSENLVPSDEPTNVTRAPMRSRYFFHVGRYGVNNLSPEDRAAWLTLRGPGRRTRVAVRLWRVAPPSTTRADLTYDILIDPAE